MGRIIGVQGDVSKKAEAARVASLIAEREPGGVTVLFNNAGILTGSFDRPSFADFSDHKAEKNGVASAYVKALFDEVPEESFVDVLKVNAIGPYWFTIAFLPLLETWKCSTGTNPAAKKFAPQVIMTSSMNGWTKDAATAGFSYPYMFSKSAVGHAVASLAHELLPLDIRVNGIAPGELCLRLR
jgi:NAD(P)-dependent dehydrogenase (short-subunit alcohol dehydrogenase family)